MTNEEVAEDYEDIKLLKLALIRSIAIEDMNIADLKKKEKESRHE